MEKVIVLLVEGEPMVFSSEERMIEFLTEQDGDMNAERLRELMTTYAASTAHADYIWGWYEVA